MRVCMRNVAASIKEGRPFDIEHLFLNTTEALAEFRNMCGDTSGHVIEIGIMRAWQDQRMAGSDRIEDKNGENILVPINLMGARGGRELTKETIQGQRRSLSMLLLELEGPELDKNESPKSTTSTRVSRWTSSIVNQAASTVVSSSLKSFFS